MINEAFADAPAWIVCPYDAACLPDEIIVHADETHPAVIRTGLVERSPGYVDPREYSDRLDRGQEAPAPADAAELLFANDDHRGMRSFVAAQADAAGLDPDRVEVMVLAANELVTNAVQYARPPVRVRIWSAHGELACEVEDRGSGFGDRLAGFEPPPADAVSGRGLWLVRQLCDSVSVLQRPSGFAVRARMALDG